MRFPARLKKSGRPKILIYILLEKQLQYLPLLAMERPRNMLSQSNQATNAPPVAHYGCRNFNQTLPACLFKG